LTGLQDYHDFPYAIGMWIAANHGDTQEEICANHPFIQPSINPSQLLWDNCGRAHIITHKPDFKSQERKNTWLI